MPTLNEVSLESSGGGVSSYASIQDAINAAGNGDTILIGAGTYKEQLVINGKDLHIIADSGATLEAPDTLAQTATVSSSGTPAKFELISVLNGANVDIQDLNLDGRDEGNQATGGFDGVLFYNASGSVSDGSITGMGDSPADGVQHGTGIYAYVDDGSSQSVQISGVTVTDFGKTGIVANGDGLIANIHDNVVTGAGAIGYTAQNGIQIGFGATGQIHDNTVSEVGYTGTSASSTGILVYESDGVSVTHNSVTMADVSGSPDAYTVGIDFDTGSNGGSVTGNTVADATAGISQDSYYGGDITAPYNVSSDTFTNDVQNFAFDANPASTHDYVITGTSGADDLEGDAGDDSLTGGAGNDFLAGDDGVDTAHYTGTLSAASFASSGGAWTVTTTAEGTDTLSGVEKATDGTHDFLLVGDGGYATIQAAVNAAQSGDTILVAAGTYAGDLTIDKALTIEGANMGLAGTDSGRGGETVINWTTGDAVQVNTTGQVTFDGLKFTGDHVITGTDPNLNVAFTDSVFVGNGEGATDNSFYFNQPSSFGFTDNKVDVTGYSDAYFQPVGDPSDASHSTVTITGNSFTGHAGTYTAGDDNDVPVIANLSDVNGTVSNNSFSNVDIGVLVANGTGPLAVEDNTFSDMHRVAGTTGGGYAAGVVLYDPHYSGELTVTGNSFEDSDAGVRTSAIPGTTTAGSPIDIADNSFTNVDHPIYDSIDGPLTASDSTIDGTAVSGVLEGGNGDDVLTSTSGNDTVSGGTGIDTFDYGASLAPGDLSYDSTSGQWTVTGSDGVDTLSGIEKVTDSSGHTFLLVDPSGSYTAIQDAINAAGNGDTILIGAGTYKEQLVIDGKDLHIVAAPGATLEAPDTLAQTATVSSSGTPAKYELISVLDGANVDIHNLNLDGRDEGSQANGGGFDGVLFYNAGGSVSDGSITGMSNGPLDGVQHGTGVYAYVDDGSSQSVEVSGLTVSDFQKTGIVANGDGLTANIHDNTVTGSGATDLNGQNGIQVGFGATGQVHDNSVNDVGYTGSSYSSAGILIYESDGVSVTHNDVTMADVSGSPDAYTLGIDFDTGSNGGSATDNTVANATAGISQDSYYGGDITTPLDVSSDTFTNDVQNFAFDANPASTHDYVVTGTSGADDLEGDAGDDSLTGGAGSDFLAGNDGVDTAHYTGALTAASFAISGGAWTVTTAADGTDTLSGVEKATDGTHSFLLVGDGGYGTIQAAVNAAQSGDTILVAAGTYDEQVTVNTSGLNLVAAGNVTLEGAFKTANGLADSDSVATFLQSAHGYASGGTGLAINADNVSVSGFNIDNYTFGVTLGDGVDGAALNDVNINGVVEGVQKGTTAGITDFSLTGGSISDGYIGVDFDKTTAAGQTTVGLADGVTVDGTSFSNLDAKGIYAEALSDAHITNISMDNVGQFGAGPAFGAVGSGGDGIDLNLKNGSYHGIEIDNFTLTDTGLSDGAGTSQKNGGAIVVEARDQGSYATSPGTVTDTVSIHDGTISGSTSTGIQLGEPGQSNATPNLSVSNVSISGAEHTAQFGDFANESAASMSITGTSGADSLQASGNTDGPVSISGLGGADTLTGGSADDTLNGGTGNDTLDGQAGLDTAVFSGPVQLVGDGSGGWTATSADGVDDLKNIERVDDSSSHHTLLVGDGGYATIQAAVAAASDGDTIMVADGTYNLGGQLDITKEISIVGESEAGVQVTGASSGYGIYVTADNVSLSDFTLNGAGVSQGGNYGIKVNPDTGAASDRLDNFSLDHVTVDGFGRSEVDLNGVSGATISHLTADGDNTAGVGLAITDSSDLAISDLATSGNQWGSVGLYPTNTYYDSPTNDITFSGGYTHGEQIGIYVDDESATHDVTNLTFPTSVDPDQDGHVWTVTNDAFRGSDSDFFTYDFANQSEAQAFALAIQSTANNATDGAGATTDNTNSVVHGPDGHLYVAAGMSLQAAIDAASSGDTIVVAAGTYTGDLTVDKALTIEGANAGVDGAGARGAESVIQGQVTVTAGATLDGLEILNTTDNTTPFTGVKVSNTADDVTVTNTLFYSNGPNANWNTNSDDRGVNLDTSVTGDVTVSHDLFTGASAADFSTASWARGVWSDGAASHLNITDDTFNYVRSGLNLDGYDDAKTTVSGNDFQNAGTGISVGIPVSTSFTGIHDNSFDAGVAQAFNFQNVTTAVNLNLAATNNIGDIAVLGGSAGDSITGGAGNDILAGNGGGDNLNGGAGDDTVDYSASSAAVAVNLGILKNGSAHPTGGDATGDVLTSIENVVGSSGSDKLTGDSGANLLYGGNGSDTLSGAAGADTMYGGDGSDTYIVDNTGDQAIETDPAGGTDVVKSSVSYTLGDNIENLVLTGVDAIDGTGNTLDNTLTGNAEANLLTGDDGNDVVRGLAGTDTIYGGAGADKLSGGDDNDALYGGTENDKITGDNGNDVLYGDEGNDSLTGGAGADTLYGGDGNDKLDGGTGADHMEGGAGNDTYTVDNTGDTVTELAGGGTDTVLASVTYTLSDNIEIVKLTGPNSIDATGNSLDNTMTGSGGANNLFGMDGNDMINAGSGDDHVYGGTGNDKLNGQDGNDFLYGGAGADMLTGGTGNDTFVFGAASDSTATAMDVITDFTHGQDKVDLSAFGALDFIGTSKFSDTAGEVRYSAQGANVIVQADTNGDGQADFTLKLLHLASLDPSDFII